MKKRLIIAVIVCLLSLSFAIPALATRSMPTEVLLSGQNDILLCSKCGKDIHRVDNFGNRLSTESQLAKALGLTLCLQCWQDVLNGSDRSDILPAIVKLDELGKIPAVQLGGSDPKANELYLRSDRTWATPATPAGSVEWGSITGTLSDQTDLQNALNGKLSAITGTALDNVFSSNGLLKRTGTGTYIVDTNNYLTANQSITLSGDSSGSGTTSIAVTNSGLKGVALPALTTGYLYYSGSAFTFQTPAGSSGMTTLMKPSPQTINSGAGVYTDITGLTFPVVSGKGYAFKFYIVFQSSVTTTGYKASVNCPTGTLDFFCTNQTVANSSTVGVATWLQRHSVTRDDMTLLTGTITAGVDLVVMIEGRYLCTANGTFSARFANELAANTNLVVQAGSWGYYFESTAAK